MKWIEKHTRNEPATLKVYRHYTPNPTYAGFVDTEQKLKFALCKEQGHICCYCMQRIEPVTVSVEHFITQKHHKDSPLNAEEHKRRELKYDNMLGSCRNTSRNCSEIRGNTPLSINPLKKHVEQQIGFSTGGSIFAIEDNLDVIKDLNTLGLGLNDKNKELLTSLNVDLIKHISQEQLVKNRKVVLDKVRQDLDRKGWSKKTIEKEIEKWETPFHGKFEPYCQVAIFYLKTKLRTYP